MTISGPRWYHKTSPGARLVVPLLKKSCQERASTVKKIRSGCWRRCISWYSICRRRCWCRRDEYWCEVSRLWHGAGVKAILREGDLDKDNLVCCIWFYRNRENGQTIRGGLCCHRLGAAVGPLYRRCAGSAIHADGIAGVLGSVGLDKFSKDANWTVRTECR